MNFIELSNGSTINLHKICAVYKNKEGKNIALFKGQPITGLDISTEDAMAIQERLLDRWSSVSPIILPDSGLVIPEYIQVIVPSDAGEEIFLYLEGLENRLVLSDKDYALLKSNVCNEFTMPD